MVHTRIILLAVFCLFFINCADEKHQFPTEKRYWDTKDYEEIVRELNFGYQDDEKLPSFDDPETRIVVEKLTDRQNYSVVLDDQELGLKHRNEIAEAFFKNWKEMHTIYQATDRKDNYIYDKEMIAVWHFGLGLQLKYFKLGNEEIAETADDPNSTYVTRTIDSNVNTLIENYTLYLDQIKNEAALSNEGKVLLSEGIDKYFVDLVQLYPDANYNEMEKKIELMEKKAQHDQIKRSLSKLSDLLASTKPSKVEVTAVN